MKTLKKMNQGCKNFKSWTHYYEDGPMVSNETKDDKYWVQVAIDINNNKSGFSYRIFDVEADDVISTHQNDTLDLSYINHKLTELGDYRLELTGDDYLYLLSVETI